MLTILQKLDDTCSDTIKPKFRAELSHSRLSEDDKTYQKISKQYLCHPNTKQHTNPVYETDCVVLENDGAQQIGVGDYMMSLESNSTHFKIEDNNPNGVYELQKLSELG